SQERTNTKSHSGAWDGSRAAERMITRKCLRMFTRADDYVGPPKTPQGFSSSQFCKANLARVAGSGRSASAKTVEVAPFHAACLRRARRIDDREDAQCETEVPTRRRAVMTKSSRLIEGGGDASGTSDLMLDFAA
ncbi:MAG TPA: hypothetical protein VG106_08145, partial [Vicinamibacterales bacterium]|nr:hypothetical protein [Vicinamibacterales bacterium]